MSECNRSQENLSNLTRRRKNRIPARAWRRSWRILVRTITWRNGCAIRIRSLLRTTRVPSRNGQPRNWRPELPERAIADRPARTPRRKSPRRIPTLSNRAPRRVQV